MSEPLLSVRGLRVSFSVGGEEVPAVDGVSFDVMPRETLGIVGESGSGKTVTSLSILRLLPERTAVIDEASSICFEGDELLGLKPRRMKAIRGDRISMIFQEPMSSLNPVYTIGNQVAEALRLGGMSRRAAWAEAAQKLEDVEIPAERMKEYPHQLSGGMRQRVMIAIALCRSPSLLIADEPTTALDVTTQSKILELLARERERRELAVLLITHDLGVVAEVCDRVAVMYAGQIVETGTVDEVFANPAHPYTRGLLASQPSLERRGERLAAIRGTVPHPKAWPAGCRFNTRCIDAVDRCRSNAQELVRIGSTARTARCWRAEGPSTGAEEPAPAKEAGSPGNEDE